MSDYLSEEEQLARMKSWWDENGTTIIVAVLVSVAAIVGWRWYGSHSADQVAAASTQYEVYREATIDNDTAAATTAANSIKENYAGSAYHGFVLFAQAKQAVGDGDLATAETALSEVVASTNDDLLRDLARIRLGKVQQALDKTSQALATLAAVKNAGYRPWALEAQGDIHAAAGDIKAAHESYNAAFSSLDENDDRPILKMKLQNMAPSEGLYVELENNLDAALQRAEEALSVEGDAEKALETGMQESELEPGGAGVESVNDAADDQVDSPATSE